MCCLLLSSDLSLNKCFEFEFNKNLLFSKVVFFKCCSDGKRGGGGGAFIRDGATNGGNTVSHTISELKKKYSVKTAFFHSVLHFAHIIKAQFQQYHGVYLCPG